MTMKAKSAIRIGPTPYPSSSFLRTAALVATFLVTFLSKREVALRRRAALFPDGILGSRSRLCLVDSLDGVRGADGGRDDALGGSGTRPPHHDVVAFLYPLVVREFGRPKRLTCFADARSRYDVVRSNALCCQNASGVTHVLRVACN